MTHPTTQTPKKLNKRRELNVIYFVDSDRTRSFKLSLGTVKLVAGVVALIGIWAFASFWVLISMVNQQEHANTRITQNQGVIFDFQARYGNVYETAYPKGERLIAANTEKPKAAKKKKDQPKDSKSKKKTGKAQLAAKKPKPTPKPVVAAATPKPTPKPVPKVDKPTVKIENSRFSAADDTLVMKFAIRNTISPQKALGYMWGIGTYKADNGDTLYVGYPSGIEVNSTGSATNTNRATRYNIRRFKPVKVTFQSPQGVPGKFETVKIMVMDREGNRQSNDLPVSVSVGFKPVPTPEPTPSAEPTPVADQLQSTPGVVEDEPLNPVESVPPQEVGMPE